MDMDNGKFYEEEENVQENDGVVEDAISEMNDMKYFLELLKHIRSAITNSPSVPLTGKKIVDGDKCLMIIDDMERNLPDAVQYGLQMYSERDRILGNAESAAMSRVSSAEMRANAALEKAKNEAEQQIIDAQNEARAILSDAQERADHMVSEDEIVRRAREEARAIKNDARVEASETKLKASHDAYQLLTSVEDELNEALMAIRHHRKELGDAVE